MAYTTINKSSEHFSNNLHSGTGSARNITGIGFQPDFTIVKRRDTTGVWYNTDIVRGAGKQMYLNETGGMGGSASTTEITGFNSDGFNLGTDVGVNASGGTYVSYNFLGNNTTGSANTDGTISSTVSANTTSGFSIVSYTGTGTTGTIGHGLGVAPSMYIVKKTSASEDWEIYHKSLGATKDIRFTTGAAFSSTLWNNTEPTSAVFNVLTGQSVNNSGSTYIAYCFAEKQGYSKFGSYTGNGNADGTFVYTGFKPSWIMIKRTDANNQWIMLNNKMSLYNNNTGDELYADSSAVQNSFVDGGADFLSNGFKLRGTNGSVNLNGGTYIYMAFAEAPLVGNNNVPCTAR